jgi:hypothetical protein
MNGVVGSLLTSIGGILLLKDLTGVFKETYGLISGVTDFSDDFLEETLYGPLLFYDPLSDFSVGGLGSSEALFLLLDLLLSDTFYSILIGVPRSLGIDFSLFVFLLLSLFLMLLCSLFSTSDIYDFSFYDTDYAFLLLFSVGFLLIFSVGFSLLFSDGFSLLFSDGFSLLFSVGYLLLFSDGSCSVLCIDCSSEDLAFYDSTLLLRELFFDDLGSSMGGSCFTSCFTSGFFSGSFGFSSGFFSGYLGFFSGFFSFSFSFFFSSGFFSGFFFGSSTFFSSTFFSGFFSGVFTFGVSGFFLTISWPLSSVSESSGVFIELVSDA